MTTYSIRLHTLPEMLQLLKRSIRCQNINDTKVIDRIHIVVRLVRGPKPTLVLVEDEILTLASVFLRKFEVSCAHGLQVGFAHRTSHGYGVGRLGTFDGLFASNVRNVRLQKARNKRKSLSEQSE